MFGGFELDLTYRACDPPVCPAEPEPAVEPLEKKEEVATVEPSTPPSKRRRDDADISLVTPEHVKQLRLLINEAHSGREPQATSVIASAGSSSDDSSGSSSGSDDTNAGLLREEGWLKGWMRTHRAR